MLFQKKKLMQLPLDSFNIQESSSTNDYHTEPLDPSSNQKQ